MSQIRKLWFNAVSEIIISPLLQTFRYGTIDELKETVKKFHKVGIKVLGDAVLNHRCAHFKNSNGVWNLFGGRLNWDDRAVVADDPHFQVTCCIFEIKRQANSLIENVLFVDR